MTAVPVGKGVRDLLDSINAIRTRAGARPLRELPKGERETPDACPLSLAFLADGCGYVAVGEMEDRRLWVGERRLAEAMVAVWGERDADVDLEAHDEEGEDEWWGYVFAPHWVGCFVRCFDEGMYPDLVLAKGESQPLDELLVGSFGDTAGTQTAESGPGSGTGGSHVTI